MEPQQGGRPNGGATGATETHSVLSPWQATKSVGEILRAVRRRRRLSMHDVEEATGHEFKASVLGAYERGERAISVPRLQRLAQFYEVSVNELFADGDGQPRKVDIDVVAAEGGAGQHEPAPVTIDLTKLGAAPLPQADLLSRYFTMIASQRRGFDGSSMTIRSEDLSTLAALIEVPAEALVRRLDELGVLVMGAPRR